jgi:hypothetical protein
VDDWRAVFLRHFEINDYLMAINAPPAPAHNARFALQPFKIKAKAPNDGADILLARHLRARIAHPNRTGSQSFAETIGTEINLYYGFAPLKREAYDLIVLHLFLDGETVSLGDIADVIIKRCYMQIPKPGLPMYWPASPNIRPKRSTNSYPGTGSHVPPNPQSPPELAAPINPIIATSQPPAWLTGWLPRMAHELQI